jgi:pectin methylesterase-like acyl-CoA thioesterase
LKKRILQAGLLFIFGLLAFQPKAQTITSKPEPFIKFPAHRSQNVNPDVRLELTFQNIPTVNNQGEIRIYDRESGKLVDKLDMSIPAGPTERTTAPQPPYIEKPYEYPVGNFTNANTKAGKSTVGAEPTPGNYQLSIIGGFTEGFHFYPILVHDKKAIIQLHHNLLEYGKTYYVEIDPTVFTLEGEKFEGVKGKDSWYFSTKKSAPSLERGKLVVAPDGSGDFNTVQGALDFVPDFSENRISIFVKKGIYEEIVYFRNKKNISIIGEDREKTIVQYANSEKFNPHPPNIAANEAPGTFPHRSAVISMDNCNAIHLMNLTIQSLSEKGKAEGLLVNGGENMILNVTVIGSENALQSNGSAYFEDVKVEGQDDLILGRGPAYFKNCEFHATGAFMSIRNTDANHGNVFVDCSFIAPEGQETVFAQSPQNKGKDYPYAEAILINSKLQGISAEGWGTISSPGNVRFWEFNSTSLADGSAIDVSQRHPDSKQLSMETDKEIIEDYMDPSFVLGGWIPGLAPIILNQPMVKKAKAGEDIQLNVSIAAVPEANFQWSKNGSPIEGANKSELIIENAKTEDRGEYKVEVSNAAGKAVSEVIVVLVF